MSKGYLKQKELSMENKFTIGSVWKTRGGWRAVVVRIDDNVLIIAQDNPNNCEIMRHKLNGKGEYDVYDLIEPWVEPVTHEGWVNIHWMDDGEGAWLPMSLKTRDECDSHNTKGRIACIKISFTEGEGL